ncbi:EamA family transporter RarD [Aquibium microcysteis]|uniref:EamA family transporter RarD n=1 Tax=Aquibium microcysteis TaxID=675281 RepID=UPI00165D22A2|nr:EamA family transporter RarD [Aquibium microcysteis]
MTPDALPEGGARRGFVYALLAYGLWGTLPLFLKAVSHLPALEVVAHRVLWSIPIAGAVLVATGRTGDLKAALRSPRTVALASLTAGLISINWGIYVWAIAVERTVETSLGYYINPLMSVVMGMVLLGERLSRSQVAALGLATCAVILMTVEAGVLPWVALVLAGSFTIYGFLRKTLPIGPSQGFFLEILILSVPALAYAIWLHVSGTSHFVVSQPQNMMLLLACGPATAVPLLLYGFGAKLLKLSTLGIMQYIAPTGIFLIAVFAFGEPFGMARLVAFALIWVALAIYTWSMVSQARDRRAADAAAHGG